MWSFDSTAYGKPASKSRTITASSPAEVEEVSPRSEESVKSTVSGSLLDSRWSNTKRAGQSVTPKRKFLDNGNNPPLIEKQGGNVVVQSVSLISSPRRPKSQADTLQSSPSAFDRAETPEAGWSIADDQTDERKVESSKTSERICPAPPTNSCDTAAKGTETDFPNTIMPVVKKQPGNDEDRLRELQEAQMKDLRQINANNIPIRNKAKFNTVRIEDLYLARTPVDPSNPAASVRTWIDDSVLPHHRAAESYHHDEQDEQPVDPLQDSEKTHSVPNQANVRASRWPSKADMKPEKLPIDENAWGSDTSEDTRASNIPDNAYGKLLHKKTADAASDTYPVGWDGKWLPPPDDDERMRYNNNNETYKDKFDLWLADVQLNEVSSPRKPLYFSNGLPMKVIATDILEDIRNCPDGISMINAEFTMNANNSVSYGYDILDSDEKADVFIPIDMKFQKEKANPDYVKYKQETTEILVMNWLKHRKNARQLSVDVGTQRHDDPAPIETPVDDRFVPQLNIYIRPATEADLEELTRIYNLHIEHGIAPTELYPIREEDMLARMDYTAKGRLPFIVAAKMSQKGARLKEPADSRAYSFQRRLPVSHQAPQRLSCVEILAGFACAQNLTAADYVERTSAELEIYVDPVHKKKGVGKCLLDKLLQICDRGHQLLTNCDFHCAPDIRHFYDSGGLRELHKLYILCRKWNVPKPARIQIEGARRHRKLPMRPTNGDDFNIWLKDWLESCGFEIEGLLKKIGAKDGRYVDLVYFGRETIWQPKDGEVPPPDPCLMENQDIDEDDEDENEEGVAI